MRSVAAAVLTTAALFAFAGVASADPVSNVVGIASGVVGSAAGLVGQVLAAASGLLNGVLGGIL